MHILKKQHILNLQQWFESSNRRSPWDQIGQGAAIALAFAIPVSTALTSLLAIIVLLTWAVGPNQTEKWQILRYHPLLKWIYLLIVLAFVGALYSEGSAKAIRHGLVDALRLALIPMLLYYYQPKKIAETAIWAFVFAMVLTLILGFLKLYADFPIGLKYTVGAVFKSHIKTSYFMAIAAFFLLSQIKETSSNRRWLIAGAVLMIYYLFFMSIGRIGYLSILILAAILAWEQYRIKGVVIATAVVGVGLGVIVLFSSVFADRLLLLSQDLVVYQQGGDLQASSLGSRLAFAKDSITLIQAHPWFGTGTGSFGAVFASLPTLSTRLYTDNPHNEFLRMGVEYGVLGMLLLSMLFYRQWQLCQKMDPKTRLRWQGILLTFIVGCLFNSWISDSAEGYFFCVMTAICFGSMPLMVPQPVSKAVIH